MGFFAKVDDYLRHQKFKDFKKTYLADRADRAKQNAEAGHDYDDYMEWKSKGERDEHVVFDFKPEPVVKPVTAASFKIIRKK